MRCLVLCLLGTLHGAAYAQEKIVLAEELEVRGMDCVPQVTEVETRRPIPIICQTDNEVAGVELRYRFEGSGDKKWEKLELKQTEAGWGGTIPCTATSRKGNLKVYVFARNEDRKVVARMGRNTAPMNIKLVESTSLPPPALPNKEAPDRCFSKTECPPEMIGTAACPGTSVGKASKGAWGAGCAESGQCQDGLECVAGSCETPPKCETTEDCPSGGECTDGACRYPTEAELAERLGPPKIHWFGLHFGIDFSMVREATGVCGGESEDSKDYACFKGGNVYTGIPNDVSSGAVPSGIHLATMRALMSYDFVLQTLHVRRARRLGVPWVTEGLQSDPLRSSGHVQPPPRPREQSLSAVPRTRGRLRASQHGGDDGDPRLLLVHRSDHDGARCRNL